MAVVATDFEESGFFWIWTVACGIEALDGGTAAVSLAVSFLGSPWMGAGAVGLTGATEGGFGAEGGTVAEGGTGAAGGRT